VIGTYSSIFIASPMLILLGSIREPARAGAEAQKARP
jgi:preprotein translocase subunit SecF